MMRSSRTLLGTLALLGILLAGCRNKSQSGHDDAEGSGQQGKTSGSDTTSHGADTGSSSGRQGRAGEGSGSGAGVPVGTVTIPQANLANAGIRVAPVQVVRVPQQLTVAGQVVTDERHTDHIGARADGVIERVLVLPGDAVHAGQTLAWLHSHMVHETAGALAQAFAAVDRQTSGVSFAQANQQRYQHLLALQVASQEEAQRAGQELKQAQQALADAQAQVHMEREHLSELLQVSPQTITAATLYKDELVPVRAEGAGNVLQREVTPGQVVNTGQETFVVSNLSTVWITAALNEQDLARVHHGETATVTTQGYPGVAFRGTVAMLGDQLDPQTRTVPVRIVVPNPGIRLRPGMFTTANIDLASTVEGIYVPDAAIQDVNGLQAVFVSPDATHFSVRAVRLGEHAHGMVRVVEGLTPQDRIVVDGAFMVKGELLKGSVGEG